MPVLCVNSGVTYSGIDTANAGEGGTDYGVPTRFEQSGVSTSPVSFASSDYPSGYIYTATSGQEANGDINTGAQMTASISSLVDGGEITDLRTANLAMVSTPNAVIRRLVINAGSGSTDGVTFNDTITAEDILVYNCNDGFLSSIVRQNSNITNCTVVGATRFGFAQGRFTNCVDINSSNQGYFNEAATSSGTWEHDGSGTDTITESTVTDIFVDFANGDYRILASSSPGAAGAGAFIFTASGGVTGDIDFDVDAIEFSATGSATLPQPTGDISFDLAAVEFSGAASATLPQPSGDIAFELPAVEFSGAGGASLPFPVGDISFDIEAIEFSGSGGATFPQPSGDVAFDIPAIEFSGSCSVTGVSLPPGEIISPRTESNVIILDTQPNLIKLY